ncbi:MAG: hypothetical protein ABSH41_11090 [Syntrophobacteraceae bacterium]|jgi:hypothetical protein
MTIGSDKERLTAIHEAGHALVAYLFDMPIDEVSVIPEPGRKGHTISGYDNLDLERCADPETWSAIVMISLAGEVAESLLMGTDMRRIGPDDWTIAKEIVETVSRTSDENVARIKALFDKCYDQFKAMVTALSFQNLLGNLEPTAELYLGIKNFSTARLLSEPLHWSVLQDFADELIKRKHIDGESVRTFIKGRLEHYASHPEEARAPNPEHVNGIEGEMRERIELACM